MHFRKTALILATLGWTIGAGLHGQTATYSWSGFTAGATSSTTGIMVATLTVTNTSMQYSAPKYYSGTTVGSGQCGQAGGLALECFFGNITTANINLNMDFTSGGTQNGTCASIKFIIKDINADESNQTFADWVAISATDANNTAVPATNITVNLGSNTTLATSGNTKIIKGYNSGTYLSRSSTACNTTTITVTPPTGVPLKSILLNYHPDYTTCPNCYYSFTSPTRPAYQYISIGQLDATVTGSCSVIILPVELVSFDGKCNGDEKSFEWETATERNNNFFTLEGSRDGVTFTDLGQVNGSNNSLVHRHYNFSTKNAGGFNYFRLRQTDYNGESTLSSIVYVGCEERNDEALIFPNPTMGVATVIVNNKNQLNVTAVVNDPLGATQKIISLDLEQGTNQVPIDMTELAAGTYYLQLYLDGEKQSRPTKLIKL